MAAGTTRKISAASARAHTRKSKPKISSSSSSSSICSGMFKKIFLVFFMGFLAWAYHATRPPPPTLCGSPNGPPVTSSRIKLKDGRHLAYMEYGVPKGTAKHHIVFIHGINSCRYDYSCITASLSQDFVDSEGIHVVSFDRPGYGESDPNPSRTVKSLAFDIEELADQLGLGSKFYVVGFSMGGQIAWTCLKYIPHRLAGVALLAPVVNYWWPGIPSNISKEAYDEQFPQDQWALRVSHHMPWLNYWWNTQKLFPHSSVIAGSTRVLSDQDTELAPKIYLLRKGHLTVATQQGVFESIHRDMLIGFGGNWDFDPTELKNPFLEGEGSVHIWQGDEDKLVPAKLQRYIASKLPWIHYHEVSGAGHMFVYADGVAHAIIQALVAK